MSLLSLLSALDPMTRTGRRQLLPGRGGTYQQADAG